MDDIKAKVKSDSEKYQMRGDMVLIRVSVRDSFNGLKMPQDSPEGKNFHVAAIGPKVEDLRVGDRVMIGGCKGEEWISHPDDVNLRFNRERHVVYIYTQERGDEPPIPEKAKGLETFDPKDFPDLLEEEATPQQNVFG